MSSTTIESSGSTSLVESGSNYFLQPAGGSVVELSYAGAPVVAGQFSPWEPIGAEQTANGYEVAWKVAGADQYTVWYTDNNGNYLSSAFAVASGTSAALESFEASFQQDLNGDGSIGAPPPPPPPPPTVIESFGSTSLLESGSNYFLQPAGGSAVELSYAGAPVVAGQFQAPGSRSARSRRRTGMRWPGRWQAPISIRCGTPTITANTSQALSPSRRERAPRWNRSKPVSSKT